MKCEDYFKAWIMLWFMKVVAINPELKAAFLKWGHDKLPGLPQEKVEACLFDSRPKYRIMYLNEVLWPNLGADWDVFSDTISITNIYALFDVDYQGLDIFEEKIPPEKQAQVAKKISDAITASMVEDPGRSAEVFAVYHIFKPISDELKAREEQRPQITEMVGRLVDRF